MTYVAGCTDSSFSSSKCIDHRDYVDQQWVALARCDGDDMNLWTGCHLHPDKIEIEKEICDCNKSEPLYRNPEKVSTLDNIASLPATAGGQIVSSSSSPSHCRGPPDKKLVDMPTRRVYHTCVPTSWHLARGRIR